MRPAPSKSATSSPLATASPPAARISSTTSPAGPVPPPLPSSSQPEVVDDDPRALPGQLEGVGPAEPAARSGDDDDAAVADAGHGAQHARI